MLRILSLLLSLSALFFNCLNAQTGQQLTNNMGTGTPRLQLQLGSNGPNWGSFTIDYTASGGVPWSSSSDNNWSTWNVYDTATPPNYYGTITLTSDGNSVAWSSYSAGTQGYYLDGINFSFNNQTTSYQLTVTSVVTPGGTGTGPGPFPLAPPATPAMYPGTTTPIVFQVNGDKIIDNNGNSILLKGLVRPSLEWSPTGQYLSTQDLSNIANWNSGGVVAKSNVIRLDLYQGYWFDSGPVTQIGSYKQIINAIVYYATQLGMAVILDLHWVVSGQQSPMANLDSITFWQEVATDYGSFGTVLFELYNEPYNVSTSVWLNGDGVNYAGYQQLYDAVRGTGAQNICIIGGLSYAYDLSFITDTFQVNGTNIVYCSHPYNSEALPGYTGQGGTFQNNYKGIIGKFPLILTEFGTNQASSFPSGYQTMYANILSYVNANNIHYTGFAWWVQNGDPQFPCLIQDWDGTALYGGVNIHDDLVQNPPTLFAGNPSPFTSFEVKSGFAGTPTYFDATEQNGRLFSWNFGDASGQRTIRNSLSHIYSQPGSYVVSLYFIKNGILSHVNRTIKINDRVTVCPANELRGRQSSDNCKCVATNVITWKEPTSEICCEMPVSYLVYRDKKLTDLVGTVTTSDKYGNYKIKDKTSCKRSTTYAVVAVDENGNKSTPVFVTIGKKQQQTKRKIYRHACRIDQKSISSLTLSV